ncbi:MAG: hypothetical protein KDH15_19765 [Rhodocyclaceae bacterium]|nr:hypothetical protein [Rhodocyclaceae bacterium]
MASNQSDTRSPKFGRTTRLCVSVAACMALQPAHATTSIATAPLLTDSAVPPNVMFVLDDSGSMQWEIMPDDITFFAYLFPIPSANGGSQIYGAVDYSSQIPNFNSNNFYNYFLRSPHNNRIFYNPAIEYLPWQTSSSGATVAVTGDADGNVDPHAAPFNPAAPLRGTLDLDPASAVSRNANWYANGTGGCSGNMSCSIWPITFYMHVGGDANPNSQSSYVRYQMRNGKMYRALNAGAGSETEVTSLSWTAEDGSTVVRAATEERRNFANWFSYYRSRLLSARGGASLAFAELGSNYRVGFTTINHRGESSYTFKVPTVGEFSAANRDGWFDILLDSNVGASGTPLRRALQWAGEYYSKGAGDPDNPWLPLDAAECRRSFTILTTDGYWNGSAPDPSVGNSDSADGPTHTSSLDDVSDGGYKAGPPWADSYSNTLADVAMHYWKNDLQSSVLNKVKPTISDEAFWQHMNTFTLSIGVKGTLDPETVIADETFSAWPDPSLGGEKTVDDLLHAAINGRGEFIPAKDPAEFKQGLTDALAAITATAGSASSLSGNTTAVTAGSRIYQARYAAGNWSGDVVAWGLNDDGSVKFTVDPDGSKRGFWKASEEMPAPDDRKIYTSLTGVSGSLVEFLSSDSAIAGAVGGASLVEYVRGSDDNEGAGASKFRPRLRNPKAAGDVVSPLGDIVNSSPAYVGSSPERLYERTPLDGASSYQNFRTSVANRSPLVYIGANDGMLHAFDAATGKEVFAYIPSALLPKLKAMAAQDYGHQFYVDGDVVVEDVFNGGSWRTILVASLGRGAKTLFALDVTTPVSGGAVNITAGSLLWELNGNTTNKLGHVLGTPLIAPLNNGDWGVIVGNGYNSADDDAHLVIINALTGSVIKVLDTDGSTSNGLLAVGGWDDDADGDIDYVYGGDLRGQLWKFELLDGETQWTTANKSGAAYAPVFTATDENSKVQPISAGPLVGSHPDTGELWIFFGTGKFVESSDRGDTSVQTWYGVRDMITDAVPSKSGRNRSALVERVIKEEGTVTRVDGSKATYRLISDVGEAVGGEKVVDASGNYLKHGWYLDLRLDGTPGAGERMLVRNILLKDILLGSTFIPNTEACGELGDGWLMAIYPWLGGRPLHDFFDVNGDGEVNGLDSVKDQTVSGFKHGNGGIPYLQQCGEGLCATSTSTDGTEPPGTENIAETGARGRLSWRELLGD